MLEAVRRAIVTGKKKGKNERTKVHSRKIVGADEENREQTRIPE